MISSLQDSILYLNSTKKGNEDMRKKQYDNDNKNSESKNSDNNVSSVISDINNLKALDLDSSIIDKMNNMNHYSQTLNHVYESLKSVDKEIVAIKKSLNSIIDIFNKIALLEQDYDSRLSVLEQKQTDTKTE